MFAASGSIWVDYLRVEPRVTTRKHDPIEAPIWNISGNDVFVQMAPMVDGYASDNDDIVIGNPRDGLLSNAFSGLDTDVELKPKTFIAADTRGMEQRQLIGMMQQKFQGFYWVRPNEHGEPKIFFKDSLLNRHYAEFFESDGVTIDTTDFPAWTYGGAGGTVTTEKHADYGYGMKIFNDTATSFNVIQNILDNRWKGLKTYEFGIQAVTGPATGSGLKVQFYDSAGQVVISLNFGGASYKVTCTDSTGTSASLQIAAADIVIPTNDYTMFKVKWTSATNCYVYGKQGKSGTTTSEPTYTLIYTATTVHNVVKEVKYLCAEDAVATDLLVRINNLRWEMQKYQGIYSDEWVEMVSSVQEGCKFFRYPGTHSQTATAGEAIVANGAVQELKLWDTGAGRLYIYKNVANPELMEFTIRKVGGAGDDDNENALMFVMWGGTWNSILYFRANGNLWIEQDTGDQNTGLAITSTFVKIGILAISTTQFELYADDSLVGTYDYDEENTAGINLVGFASSSDAGNNFEFRVGYFDDYSTVDTTEEIEISPSGKKMEVAASLKSVTVLGKKNDVEIVVPDPVIPDPSIDDYGDSNSPRELYIIDDELEESASLRDKAVAILEANTGSKINTIVNPVTDLVFHAGNYYRYTLDGEIFYDHFCRRVSAKWDAKNRKVFWTLELGTGSTFGIEKTQRFRTEVKDTLKRWAIKLR
jgi:hypothetical protein